MKLKNQGVFHLNPSDSSESQKTIVVFGVPRSGTTMAAKLLAAIGVDMGKAENVVAEDTDFASLLEKDFSEEKLKKYIQERDEKSTVWGWKRPEAFRYRNRFVKHLTNPHFIFLFRDPLAIALREHISMKEPVMPKMRHTLKRYDAILNFAESSGMPCMMISYEKAIQSPDALVEQLIEFTGVRPTEKAIKKAVSLVSPNDEAYLTSTTRSRKRLKGAVEVLTTQTIEGWAAYTRGMKKPVLNCFVNEELVATITPDIDRPELKKRLTGDTMVGFKALFDAELSSDQISELKVVDAQLGTMLRIKQNARG